MSYAIKEVTLTEKMVNRSNTKNYFKLDCPNVREMMNGTTPLSTETIKRIMFEVIEVHPPYGGKPFFLSFDAAQYPTLRALLGHTEQTIERKMEEAREDERRFSEWRCNQIVGEQRDKIRALPWWKRLFKKF